MLCANIGEWEAITTSSNAFPAVDLVSERHVIIPNGTDDMCTEYPQVRAVEIGRFLGTVQR